MGTKFRSHQARFNLGRREFYSQWGNIVKKSVYWSIKLKEGSEKVYESRGGGNLGKKLQVRVKAAV